MNFLIIIAKKEKTMDYNKKIILYGLSMFKDNVIRMLGDKYGSWENAKEHILFFSDSNSLYWGGYTAELI